MAAQYQIRRYADYTVRVTVTIDSAPMDHTLYTFVSKIRDVPTSPNVAAGDFLPGGVLVFAVTPVVGQTDKLDLVLTDTQTTTILASTTGQADARRPRLDIKFTRISDGFIDFTDAQPVDILDTVSYA